MSKAKMAAALGMDASDFGEYEYQPGHWSHRVYAVGDEYFTLTRGQKPPRVTGRWEAVEWGAEWRRVEPSALHLAPEGYTVWVSRS